MLAGANNVDLIFNDLSIEQQFQHESLFRQAMGRILELRRIAAGNGREVYCHRGTVNRLVNATNSVFQEIQKFPRETKLSLLLWLDKQGPFWNDSINHDPDEVFECKGDIVTETSVAEAAYYTMVGLDCSLVSLTPSAWNYSPVVVTWLTDNSTKACVPNFWEPSSLEIAFQQVEPPIASWAQMESVCRQRFQRLSFTDTSFIDLRGRPFIVSAARRIVVLLNVLNRLKGDLDNEGQLTTEGQRLYQQYFVGLNARFSDSSATEKHEFRQQLTFRDPNGGPLFCTWHGKVNNPAFRVHFSWPVPPNGQLYIAYVGRKITGR